MGEPPTPTPSPMQIPPRQNEPAEEPCRQKQGTVCCNLQTVMVVMTVVNTALLCIILGCLIGHR
jgi:hypothetical protein